MTKQKKQEPRLKRWEIEEYISWQSRDNRWRLRWVDIAVPIPLVGSIWLFALMLFIDPIGSLFAWLNPGKSTVYVLSDLHWLRVLSLPVLSEFLVRCVVIWMIDTVVEPCRKQAEFLLNGLPQICRKPGRLSYIFAFISAVCVLLSYSSCYYFTDKAIIHTSIIPSSNWRVPYEYIGSADVHIWYGHKGHKFIDCNFHIYNGRRIHLSEYNLVLNRWTDTSEPTEYVHKIISRADYKQKHYQIHQKFKAYFPIPYR